MATPAPQSPQPRVIIIGAGIAGLAAANVLSKEAVDVCILEGSGRVGGRCCSTYVRVQHSSDLVRFTVYITFCHVTVLPC